MEMGSRGEHYLFMALLAWHGCVARAEAHWTCMGLLASWGLVPSVVNVTAESDVPLPEVSTRNLRLYADTPVGALVRLTATDGQETTGIAVHVNYETVTLRLPDRALTLSWNVIARVTAVDEHPVALEQEFPGVTTEIRRGAAAHSRLEHYAAFQRLSETHWGRIRPEVLKRLPEFRASGWLFGKGQKAAELHAEVNAAVSALVGANDFALHYNMHGGTGFQFADAGGIRATLGDSIVSGWAAMDRSIIGNSQHVYRPTVFYYSSTRTTVGGFAAKLTSYRASPSRRSVYLLLFDPHRIVEEKRGEPYSNLSANALSFPRLAPDGIGVRYEDLLLPPLLIGADVDKRLRLSGLSSWEKTFATLLHLKSLLSDPATKRFLLARAASEPITEPVDASP